MDRFANCGSGAWLQVNEAGDDMRIASNKCHHRWCPACSAEKGSQIAANILDKLDVTHCRFLTFTLRHSDTPLGDQIDRLYRSFAALRRRADWITHVTGGAAFFEGKISDEDGLWHPHLHVLIEGQFWDQREISRLWHKVTGDSSIVFIEAVGNAEGQAKYLAKYIAKPAHETVYARPDKLDELIVAMRGRRVCLTFGGWRGWKILAKPKQIGEWRNVAPLDGLQARAAEGDELALRYRAAAARKWPLLAIAYGWPQGDSS